jgi:intracellular multiplication protein IcmQ
MDKPSGLPFEKKNVDLKQKLLDCLEQESHEFLATIQTYFSQDQLSQDDRADLLRAVIAAVDHVLSAGEWDTSLFLRNTLKPLQAIKAEAQAELDAIHHVTSAKTIEAQPIGEDESEVYISLFQSDGYNINKWAVQVRSLDRYMIGRPIYQSQEDIEKRIRLRAAANSEAYVAVVVKKSDIQSDTFAIVMKDQFDHPLLQLKERALQRGRIAVFVHQGVRYRFVDGQLVKE